MSDEASENGRSASPLDIGQVLTRALSGAGLSTIGAASAAIGLRGVLRRSARGTRGSCHPELDVLLAEPEMSHGFLDRPDGARIAYVDSGEPALADGPTLVLLHGITGQWWMWSSVINLARRHRRVIAWDMRGFGGSRAGSLGVTMEAAADDLVALLERLGLVDVVIAGHSMGGMVLGRFAVGAPRRAIGRVRGYAFVSTVANSKGGSLVSGGPLRLGASLPERMHVGTGVISRVTWTEGDLSTVLLRQGLGRIATAAMVEVLRRCQLETEPLSYEQGLKAIVRHDVLDGLRDVERPSLVTVGTLDRLTPTPHSEAIAAAIRGSELAVLEGIGHHPQIEDPETLVELLAGL